MKIIKSIFKHQYVKDTIVTTVLNTIGKSIGMIVPFFIALWFGAGITMDMFFLSYSIIIFFSNIFGVTISKIVVPYIVEQIKLKENIGKFISSILLLSCISATLLLLIGSVLTNILLRVITDFSTISVNQVSSIIIEMIPFVVLLIWTNTLNGVFYAFKRFKLPVISPAYRAIINILLIFFLKDYIGIHSIIAGYSIGEFIRFLTLVLVIQRKQGIKFYFSITLNKKLIEFLKKGLYQVIAMILFSINPLIDKTMASWKGPESVSILFYADMIYLIPATFLVSGFLATLLSYMSERFYLENKIKLKKFVHKTAIIAGIVTLCIVIPGIFLYKPVIYIILNQGELNANIIVRIQNVFFGYFTGLFPYVISQIYGYTLIVFKKTKILMFFSIITFILNIILNYTLMQIFNLTGLSLSTSIIRVINCIFYSISFYVYYKKIK